MLLLLPFQSLLNHEPFHLNDRKSLESISQFNNQHHRPRNSVMANRNSANLFIDVCDAYMPEWLRISSGGHQTDPKERIRNVLPFVIDACNNAKMGTRTCDRLWAMLEEPSLELKDALLSMQHRRFGDELAEKGDLAEALVVLNQAVMRGPPKGTLVLK